MKVVKTRKTDSSLSPRCQLCYLRLISARLLEPLDKLEILVKAQIKHIKARREQSPDSIAYIQGLQTEVETLEWVWSRIDEIKRNAPSVADDMIKKLYGSS